MKIVKKSVGIAIIAAICIAAFVFGFFGLTTYYGDTENIIIKSPDQVKYDADLGSSVTLIFEASNPSTALTKEQLDIAKTVFAKRLDFLKVPNYDIYCDYANGKINIKLPTDANFSLDWLVSVIGEVGDVYIKSGSEATSSYIFTNEQVTNIKVSSGTVANLYQSFTLDVVLNAEGRDALRMSSEAMTDTYERSGDPGYLSLWYGEEMRMSQQITDKPIRNGKVSFTSYNLDEQTFAAIGMYLYSGQMPAAMKYSTIKVDDAEIGENALSILGIALLSAFGAIFIFLIIRYGIIGFVGLLSALGTAGVTMFFISGFFYGRGFSGTLVTFGGLLLVLLICAETTIRDGSSITKRMETSSFEKSVSMGLKSTLWQTLKIYIITFVFSIVMVLCGNNGTIASLLRTVGLPSSGILTIGALGSVMLAGIFAATVFSFFGSRILLKVLTTIIKKPQLYGGGKDE